MYKKGQYKFGAASEEKLKTCHPDLQRVVRRALSYGILDLSVTEGHRTTEKQAEYFRDGKSKLDGVKNKSKHQETPSRAVDLMPFPAVVFGKSVWEDTYRFHVLIGLMLAAASEEGVEIISGSDWGRDGSNTNDNFQDLPHFELA